MVDHGMIYVPFKDQDDSTFGAGTYSRRVTDMLQLRNAFFQGIYMAEITKRLKGFAA